MLSLKEFQEINIPDLSDEIIESTESYCLYFNESNSTMDVLLLDEEMKLTFHQSFKSVEEAEVFLEENFKFEGEPEYASKQLSEVLSGIKFDADVVINEHFLTKK